MKRKLMLVLLPLAAMAVTGCGKIDRGDKNPDEPGQCESVSVTLNKTSLSLALGGTETLVATVNPADCSVIWTTSNPAVASVSQSGKVTGVSEGTATITVGNATCTVTVSSTPTPPDPEKEVVEVTVTDHPATVYQGEEVNPGLVELTVAFSDETSEKVFADSIECDTSEIGDVTATATNDEYGSATFTISVIEKEESTMKEAYEAAAALGQDQVTAEMTFSGVVVGYRSATNDYFLQDGEYGIDIWNPSNKSIFEVGKKLTVTATLQNYGGIIETKTIKEIKEAGTGTMPAPVVVDGLVALTTSKVNTLAQINSAIVEEAPEYSAEHDLSLDLTVNDEKITVFFKKAQIANYKTFIESLTDGCEIRVKKAIVGKHGSDYQLVVADQTEFTVLSEPERALDYIAIEGELAKTTYTEGQAYSSNGLYVMAYYDDGTSGKVSATITIDKTTAALGDNSLTFSAEFEGETASITVNNITVNEKSDEGQGAVYTFKSKWTQAQNFSSISASDFEEVLQVEGDEIITGYKDATNAYIGGNGGDSKTGTDWKLLDCLKVGKNSASGTITINLDDTIGFSGIKMSVIGARDDGTLTVNGITKNVTKKAVKDDLATMDLEFDIDGGISELVLSSKEASSGNYGILITRIEFIGGGVTPTPPTPPDPDKEIDHIAIEGTPSKLSYAVGESYSANGLHIEAYYDDETHATISGTITPSKTTAEEGDTTISFNATVDGFVAQTVTFDVEITGGGGGETQTTTVTKTIAEIASANSWVNETQYFSFDLDSNISVSTDAAEKKNTGKYYSSDSSWRIYQNENYSVTITAANGYKITSVTIEYGTKDNGVMIVDGNQVTSGTENKVNSVTTFSFSAGATKEAKGKVLVKSIKVVYTK